MKTFSYILGVVGLLTLGYCAFELLSSRAYQLKEARRFANSANEAHGRPADQSVGSESMTAPDRQPPVSPAIGSVVGMLMIPRLGISTVVIEGAEEPQLKLGPGHIRGTALPGEGGNIGVAGHRDTFFRSLRSIGKRDTIELITQEREYRYFVVSTQIVGPEDVHVLYPIGHETLTLVTCYPFDFVGKAPKRFIVRADCVACPRQGSHAEAE